MSEVVIDDAQRNTPTKEEAKNKRRRGRDAETSRGTLHVCGFDRAILCPRDEENVEGRDQENTSQRHRKRDEHNL